MFLQLSDDELLDAIQVYIEERMNSYKQEYVVIGFEKSDTDRLFSIELEAKDGTS